MDDNKKKILLIGIAGLAVVAAIFSISKSGAAGNEQVEVVGSLEDWESRGAANAKPGSQPAGQTANPDRPNDLTAE